jgi:uncharacterized protein (DUF362 family)
MAERRITRRGFLKATAGAAASAALPGCGGVFPVPEGFASVAILKAADYSTDLVSIIDQGLTLAPPPDVAGKRVLLKPNLVDIPRDGRPAVTDPRVVVAAAEAFRRRGAAEVLVGDGPALQRDATEILEAAGLAPLLAGAKLTFIDLNLDDVVRVGNAGGATNLDPLYYAATAVNADVLVSLPKMKAHHWAGASLSLKNLFGTLSGQVYGWPRNRFHLNNLHRAVFDFGVTRPPDYCIVDAIVGMEGDGPIHGTATPVGALVFGDNAAAVDATCARVMRLAPERIQYLAFARGVIGPISEANIEQRGESIAAAARPFATVEQLSGLRL